MSRLRASQSGMTLIEVMIAALILAVGALGVVAMVDRANKTTADTKSREIGTNVARELVEAARSVSWENLTPPALTSELQSAEGLADAEGGNPWTLVRRGTTYTIRADVCSIDDPQDGLGPRAAGVTWCTGLGPAGTTDANSSEDYRRVTVSVSWREGTATRTARQSSLVNNGDNGPALEFVSGPTGTITNGQVTAGTSVGFQVRTATPANRVEWYLNGVYRDQATSAGDNLWNFTWTMGAPPCLTAVPGATYDGNYFVSAQAYNGVGASPGPKVRTVTVNRCAPLTPGLEGGGRVVRPGDLVEMGWQPNPERDIVGYRVYRVGQSSPETGSTAAWAAGQECAGRTLFESTTCVFDDPGNSSGYLYEVAAVDRDPNGNLRESPVRSVRLSVLAGNSAPNVPRNVSAVRQADGDVFLSWQQPSGGGTSFYRVYRGGTLLADRYTDQLTTTSYEDQDPNGQPYFIVAVGANWAEGPVAGPIAAP